VASGNNDAQGIMSRWTRTLCRYLCVLFTSPVIGHTNKHDMNKEKGVEQKEEERGRAIKAMDGVFGETPCR